jgi:hypothetical protein
MLFLKKPQSLFQMLALPCKTLFARIRSAVVSGWHYFSCFSAMKEKDRTGIVPEQHTGEAIDAATTADCHDIETARKFFSVVKNRLQHVNGWHDLAGKLTARFQLADAQGNEVSRPVQKGDYLKIDIPGPGTLSGEGYDWAEVEEIEQVTTPERESFGFRVRPAQNPQKTKNDISHFYSPESTSTFTVTREHTKLAAVIYDRNTKVNKPADSVTDKIRNAVVGTAGIFSFSKIQWKALTDGLLQKEKISNS